MDLNKKHFESLSLSYNEVGSKINQLSDFNIKDLEQSRSFFTRKSLSKKIPSPIDVDVYAILSGISFAKNFLDFIGDLYKDLSYILNGSCHYLVKKENLGVEYAVLKWPDDPLNSSTVAQAENILQNYDSNKFTLKIFGIQVHADGCIVLKGVDERREIFNLRKKIVNTINEIPKKQSNWAHIPLGRILEPIGADKMERLKRLIGESNNKLDYDLIIDKVHLVHEKKWYMEDKEYLCSINLRSSK